MCRSNVIAPIDPEKAPTALQNSGWRKTPCGALTMMSDIATGTRPSFANSRTAWAIDCVGAPHAPSTFAPNASQMIRWCCIRRCPEPLLDVHY